MARWPRCQRGFWGWPRNVGGVIGRRAPSRALCPPGQGAARASRTGGKARGASSPASPRGPAGLGRTASRRPRGRSGRRWCRGSRRSRGTRANEAAPARVAKGSRRRKGRMRQRCGNSYGNVVSGHRARSASGRRRKTVADPSKKWGHGAKPHEPVPGFRSNIVAWSSAGNASRCAARRSLRWLRSTSGFRD
jgi:hypothetical protein